VFSFRGGRAKKVRCDSSAVGQPVQPPSGLATAHPKASVRRRSSLRELHPRNVLRWLAGGPPRIEAAQVRAAIAASKLKRPSKVYIDVALGTGKVVIGAGASLRPEEIWGLDRADVEFYDKPRGGAPSVGSGCTSDGRADC
jgi:hypothetical protein